MTAPNPVFDFSKEKGQELSDVGLRAKQLDMGKIGAWFGSRENAALYFAGTVVIMALLGLGVIAFVEPAMRPDLVKILGAVVIGTLGYICGLLSAGK